MTTSTVTPWLLAPILTPVIAGEGTVRVKPPYSLPVPAEVVTEISLVPVVASAAMSTLAVIWVELSTVKLLTVIPEPKLTAVAQVK